MKLPLEEYFTYHPPKTKERQAKHDTINKAALEFVLTIQQNVKDEESLKAAFMAVQFARMMANQGITVDELVKEG